MSNIYRGNKVAKQCKKCKDIKPLEEFNDTFNILKDGTIKQGKRGDCKKCQDKYRKLYYSIHKDKEMVTQRIRRARNK